LVAESGPTKNTLALENYQKFCIAALSKIVDLSKLM